MRLIRLCLILGALSACSTAGPSTSFDPHLPSRTDASATHKAGQSENAVVTVRAMKTQTASGTAYALGLIVARSDLNYPKIDELRSFGKRLPYRRMDRHRIGTLRAEIGVVPLTESSLESLARTGIAFRIYGPRGPYDAHVPPVIFRQIIGGRQ